MSPVISVVLEEPAWPYLDPEQIVHVTSPLGITALANGMESGATSVALRIDLPDGRTVIAETSLAALLTAVRAIVARYGDPSADIMTIS